MNPTTPTVGCALYASTDGSLVFASNGICQRDQNDAYLSQILCASSFDAYRPLALPTSSCILHLQNWQLSPLAQVERSGHHFPEIPVSLFLSYVKTTGGSNYALLTLTPVPDLEGASGSSTRTKQAFSVRPLYATDNWGFAFVNTTGRVVQAGQIPTAVVATICATKLQCIVSRACVSCPLVFPSFTSLQSHFQHTHRYFCGPCGIECDETHYKELALKEMSSKGGSEKGYGHLTHVVAHGLLSHADPFFVSRASCISAAMARHSRDVSPVKKKVRSHGQGGSKGSAGGGGGGEMGGDDSDGDAMDESGEHENDQRKEKAPDRTGRGSGGGNDGDHGGDNDSSDGRECFVCHEREPVVTFVRSETIALLNDQQVYLIGPIRHVVSHDGGRGGTAEFLCLNCLEAMVSNGLRCICGHPIRNINPEGSFEDGPVIRVPVIAPLPVVIPLDGPHNCLFGNCVNRAPLKCGGRHKCHHLMDCPGVPGRLGINGHCSCDDNQCDGV